MEGGVEMPRTIVGFILLLLVSFGITAVPHHYDLTIAASTSSGSQGITNPGAP